jgi:fatty acid synthase
MRAAFERYGIDPKCIGYIEAHGTGTVAGDSNELKGLEAIFADARAGIRIGSVKSNMGHAEGASGLMAIIKVLLMFEHRKLLPNLHFQKTSHKQLLSGTFKVVSELEDWSPEPVAVSNYGFGGSNGFCVLAPGNLSFVSASPAAPLAGPENSFAFAARSGFKMPAGASSQWFLEQLHLGNDAPYNHRYVAELGVKKPPSTAPKIVFIGDGQGSQWNGMGQQLLKSSPVFAATIKRLATYLPELDLMSMYEVGDKWLK